MFKAITGKSFKEKSRCYFLVFWVFMFIIASAFPLSFNSRAYAFDPVPAGYSAAGNLPRAAAAYSWGRGVEGQLGQGHEKNISFPLRISSLSGMKEVSAGGNHSLMLLENGDVYAFGKNDKGQLGLGKISKPIPTPTRINLDNVEAISAGYSHSLLLKEGHVYSFGEGAYGALGHGDKEDKNTPRITEGLENVKAIAAGFHYSLVLLENGDVYAFGNNNNGQLGLGDKVSKLIPTPTRIDLDNVEAISAGYSHSLLLKEGRVYSFGGGMCGALGHGDEVDKITPQLIEGLENVKAIAAGWGDILGSHSLILLANGDVYSFGRGKEGALGLGDSNNRLVPAKIATAEQATAIAAGGMYSLILLENGELHACGQNDLGQLGLDDDKVNKLVPTRIGQVKEVVRISAGFRHSLLTSTMLLIGDVDGSGTINISDAIIVLKHIVNLIELDGCLLEAADTNKNGTIDINDAILILKYIVGLVKEF